ncbi:type I-E CRISPR-associated endoribonuclease Cas2e [Streptococcus mutans]|uniref:type I-E CRISPR-associated endoribonuclease Cas2e n=1 Tax=Streptococcus mutans TaxID=1309 RepID=UPI0001B0586E|nr:type I-E CRISPR-associated endoribonuclease Cas2e [Streptococcus mutans]EMB93963.1 DNA polymerase III subunit alpha [Streptococcus mutans M21]MCB4944759.1 type I-E CRISPR-associated endoribonuclease Cas2e [Streptococcus mutans]MCB4957962.1 type I-E CRISPR-associated endoribonuclease Cas2e [Streptococcus mutans]MCB4967332.1 type I-E CRISPR-associated endoribonuclease Cas2e [Streptococcus mutans]MCB5027078.1 type I-E CRISPR-associated endoribonuclease Cas2e [Streptococcus mutans]
MPLTVITVKNAPPSLRGDLTKWMQEIATGVYVGNFNTKVREQLWSRVKDSVSNGEATLSFAYRNEIGYCFDTMNAQRKVVDFEGIPLVQLPNSNNNIKEEMNLGFSHAAKFRKIRRYSSHSKNNSPSLVPYVVIDIETDGLDENENSIIEIGAVKIDPSQLEEFNYLVKYDKILPKQISKLTGISQELLDRDGKDLQVVLQEFLNFIGNHDLVGYGINFDIKFINKKLKELNQPLLKNRVYDLMQYAKKEKLFLDNYKLQTVLKAYEIEDEVPHRALHDSKLIYDLSTKMNKFLKGINQK